MVRAFEAALSLYQRRMGETGIVRREKTFFEKPFATILLVIVATLIVLETWQVVVLHRPLNGAYFSSLGVLFSCFIAWKMARRQHQD